MINTVQISVYENSLDDLDAGLTKLTKELTNKLNKKLISAVVKMIPY